MVWGEARFEERRRISIQYLKDKRGCVHIALKIKGQREKRQYALHLPLLFPQGPYHEIKITQNLKLKQNNSSTNNVPNPHTMELNSATKHIPVLRTELYIYKVYREGGD